MISEIEIMEKIVSPKNGDLPADTAQGFLRLKFDSPTLKEIQRLLRKNNRGTISAEERLALDKYLRVGQLLDFLHAKARLSLKALGQDV